MGEPIFPSFLLKDGMAPCVRAKIIGILTLAVAWLSEFWASLTVGRVALGVGLFLLSVALSVVVAAIVLVNIPANYFHSDYEHHFLTDRHPVLRAIAIVSKNVVGAFLIILGIILSLPGVPGPGLLTIFIGLILTDIPGKRALEVKFIERPTILSAVNKLRAKHGRPPLVLS